jgi:predicted phage terminase large subunit-like protein
MQNDPQYEARLNALPIIDRERLLAGNWDLLVQGKIFKPEWFDQFVYTRPEGFRWFRYWDLAASVRTHADFSASPAVAFDPKKGVLYVADMRKMKAEWPDVQVEIKHLMMTETDVVETGIEKKMHGLAAFQTMMRDPDLLGHRLVAVEVKGDKLERAMHWQERAAQHKVVLVHGQWVNSFINEAALFDGTGKTHDDMVDGVSGANLMAANPKWRSLQFLRL